MDILEIIVKQLHARINRVKMAENVRLMSLLSPATAKMVFLVKLVMKEFAFKLFVRITELASLKMMKKNAFVVKDFLV